jgi:hypothetical protein
MVTHTPVRRLGGSLARIAVQRTAKTITTTRAKARARCEKPLALALVALLLAWASPARADAVRVFVVGHKQRLVDAATVASFQAKMRALVDARARTPGLVQDGVLDVASRIRPRDPAAPALAVVHFPEDTGLVAGLIGSRGAAARTARTSFEAFGALLLAYGEVIDHYDAEFPGLDAQPLRGLTVALTDLLYRSVYETFRDLARTYGVYLSVSLNAAPARRIEASADRALVERVRDPDEPERDHAYVATSPLPHNLVWLFEPSGEILVPDRAGGLLRSPSETGGEILPSATKAYLTEIEQTIDKPGGGLSLASGPVRDLDVLDTPVGAIAVVISKDAWMPDVNGRFDAKGANLTLQSEAFSSWAFRDVPWDPDVFKEGGFGNLQSRAGFLFNVAPSMTGNLFDVTFDGQSAILAKRRDKPRPARRSPDDGWVGQPADSGFVAIAPWIVPDPADGSPLGGAPTLAARRRELARAGARLLPGSGVGCAESLAVGPCENGYREWILAADLDIPPGPGRSGLADGADAVARPTDRGHGATTFGTSVPLAPGGRGRQRHPRVAADGDLVAAVWDDTGGGPLPQVYLALSRDGGRHFGPALKVSDRSPSERAELLPDVAIATGEIRVVWQAFEHAFDDDAGRIELARFDARGRKLAGDLRVDGGESLAAAGRWHPSIATLPGGAPLVAWIDERDRGPDGVAFEHVYAAQGEVRGGVIERFAPAVRVDAGPPVPNSDSLDNKWAPTVVVDPGGTVQVAWVDFREYNWDVYTARSSDGGQSFSANLRVNGYPLFERICDAPRLVATGTGRTLLAWTDIRAQRPDRDLYVAASTDGGASYAPDRPLETSSQRIDVDRDPPSSQSHVALAAHGGRAWAAWQDDRAGNSDVLLSPLDAGGRLRAPAGRPERVDDTGDGPSGQYRPDLAIAGAGTRARCVVVWEDDREGRLRVYAASRRCASPAPRLPGLAVARQ